jgi:hypothetical protein
MRRPPLGRAKYDVYDSSKWALKGLTHVWAAALAEHGVRVNSLGMGAADTPMIRTHLEAKGTPPPADLMRPEQIAAILVDLLLEGPHGRTGDSVEVWLDHPCVLPPVSLDGRLAAGVLAASRWQSSHARGRPAARDGLRRCTTLGVAWATRRGTSASPMTCTCAPSGTRPLQSRARRSPTTITRSAVTSSVVDARALRKPRASLVEHFERREGPHGDRCPVQAADQLHAGFCREAPAEGGAWGHGADLAEAGGHAELDGARERPPAEAGIHDEQVPAAGEGGRHLRRSPPRPQRRPARRDGRSDLCASDGKHDVPASLEVAGR